MKGDNATAFNCTGICPSEVPHKIFSQDGNDEPYCSIEPAGPSFFVLVEFSESLYILYSGRVGGHDMCVMGHVVNCHNMTMDARN